MSHRPALALLLVALFVGSGCDALPNTDPNDGVSNPEGDPDEDGLTNAFEESIRTDPELADTDGDGYSDAEEYLTYFSPRNEEDFPYEGEYPRGPLMSQADWESYTEESDWIQGAISSGWKVTDQHGAEIKLKRFFGSVILIDVAAEWCGPCRTAAVTLEEEYDQRKDDGFVVIQLLLDGYQMGDRSPDGDRWRDDFGLTLPVIEDGDAHAAQHYVPAGSFAIPNFTVIDREHKIRSWYQAGGSPPWGLIDSLLAEDPPEVDYPMPDNADELYEALGLEPGRWVQ